ncbi:sulfotransferase family protein [Salinarimonas sp. NSM]|uniref:sulfotransferase family protein n=1 Tax=Salinarimonas sp. NSM TaxID=3458003 RepID=UPI004035BA9E
MTAHAFDRDEILRLADLVRRDDPRLAMLPLEPDGKYQTVPSDMGSLHQEMVARLKEGFAGLRPEDFPILHCGWGKCRVGSTALTNLFGIAGVRAYYQPVKTIARHLLTGGRGAPWRLPDPRAVPHLFAKEMAGPYVMAECLFIPLASLVEAGWPADRLRLLVLDRHPAKSLASWLTKWPDRIPPERLVRNYVLSALNAGRVTAHARAHGIAVTHYVYELSRDPKTSVSALFARIGLAERFHAGVVEDWNEKGALDSENAQIVFPEEPPVYVVQGLHSSDSAYRYRDRGVETLTRAHLDLLRESGVEAVYRDAAQACVAELGLDPAIARRLAEDAGLEAAA